MARKTKEDAERTYHQLLDAATRLFIRQGVAKTTLSEIAKEAQMTRGAIYWHFDNKDAVIMALWNRNANRLQQAFNEMLSEIAPPTPAENFRVAIKRMVLSVVQDPELGQIMRIVMHNMEFTDEQTELQSFLMNKKEEFYSTMENAFVALDGMGVLRTNLPPEKLASSLMSYIHGLIHSSLSPGMRNIDLQKDGEILLDLFLDALLVEYDRSAE
ncbi:MAG: TetR family transcriptional regulator [Gammaproteobacteria bacterium]|nr:TetR family transcriptional regulator [Gammaproteobacteria bacterium]